MDPYVQLIQSSTPTSAHVNAFDLAYNPKVSIYHYDVLTPQWTPPPNKTIKISALKATELVLRLQTNIAPRIFPSIGVFDGKKNLFSWRKYNLTNTIYEDVPLDAQVGNTIRRNQKMVRIAVTYVKSVELSVLQRLMAQHRDAADQALEALNMLNMSVQAHPRSMGRLTKGAAFYIPEGMREPHNIAPFQLWHGFQQTVRLTVRGPILNVDSTVGIVIPRMTVETMAIHLLKCRQPRDLDKLRSRTPQFERLKQVITLIKVCPNYGRDTRARKPRSLVADCGAIQFDNKEGRTITVGQHFVSTYNKTIRPGELGVKFASGAVVPLSCLDTVQQLFSGTSPPDVIREILKFLPANPSARLQAIQQGWEQLGHRSSEFIEGAGIRINPVPKTVNGRLLRRPVMVFGPNQAGQTQTASNHPGQWDVMRKRLHTPATITSWCVIDFSGCQPRDRQTIVAFCNDLASAMYDLGITIPPAPPSIYHENAHADVKQIMTTHGKNHRATLMIVILPENAPLTYNTVKNFGDVVVGVATQCVCWSSKIYQNYSKSKCNQYHNNLILKINAKLPVLRPQAQGPPVFEGPGRSFVPHDAAMDFFRSAATMIIGADVSHPGPGSSYPSVASVVASTDQYGSQYTARIEIQQSRVEMIEKLEEMATSCLETFFNINRRLPARIIFYRDGVSEGEFGQVMADEVQLKLRNAMTQYYQAKNAPGLPRLTVIVVTKRHHIRFIPNNPQNTDRSQNCQAGFVVENDLKRPLYQDFYLQSQAGLKGTSVPGHYTILADDIYMPAFRNDKMLAQQAIEQLTYTLCHNYSRATRSVKIPAPVYYADLVCRRAKFHFDQEGLDRMSVQSGSELDLEDYISKPPRV